MPLKLVVPPTLNGVTMLSQPIIQGLARNGQSQFLHAMRNQMRLVLELATLPKRNDLLLFSRLI